MNFPQNTPIQSKNHIQISTRSIHTRLALKTKPQGNKDEKIPGMQLNADAIQTTTNITDCMKTQKLQQATSQDDNLQQLKDYIIKGWPENKD